MNENIKTKWVIALRSRGYKQGKSFLKRYNPEGEALYCCLGVLCELYNEDMERNNKDALSTNTDCDGHTRYGCQLHVLPDEVTEWSEMNSTKRLRGSFFD